MCVCVCTHSKSQKVSGAFKSSIHTQVCNSKLFFFSKSHCFLNLTAHQCFMADFNPCWKQRMCKRLQKKEEKKSGTWAELVKSLSELVNPLRVPFHHRL